MRAHEAMRRVPDALDELVALVESARALPLSASCVVPREEVLDLLDELRAALPDALEDARGVVVAREELLGQARDRRDQAIDDARAEADRTLAAARAAAERMISADGVRRAAEAEARGVLEAARERADRLRADADAYADKRLAALEDTLSRLLGTVERGRDLLRRSPDGADADWSRLPGPAPAGDDGRAERAEPAGHR